MGVPTEKQYLIAELSHQINSPLAAIRNAVYLAAGRTDDPALLRYLTIVDEEITAISSILRTTRVVLEHVTEPPPESIMVVPATRRAAA